MDLGFRILMFLEWIETAQPRRGNGRGVREGGGGEHGNENERWVGLAAEVAVVAMAAIVVLQVCFSEWIGIWDGEKREGKDWFRK